MVRAKAAAIKEGRETVEQAGFFGGVVAWWRRRKAAKEQDQARPASPLDGVHEVHSGG
jgi:phosphoglycolate phosphatase-like HAD superfamily hydrolase